MVVPALPPELWLQIFEIGPDDWEPWTKRTIALTLCRVSRQFDKLARPILYRRLDMSSDAVAPFVRTITARPELGALVRVLDVNYGWGRFRQSVPLTEDDGAMLSTKAREVGLVLPEAKDSNWVSRWTLSSPAYHPLVMLLISLLPNLEQIDTNEHNYSLLWGLPNGSYLSRLKSVSLNCYDTDWGLDPSDEMFLPLWNMATLESVAIFFHFKTERAIFFHDLRKMQLADSYLDRDGQNLRRLLGSCTRLEIFLYSNWRNRIFNPREARPRSVAAALLDTPAAKTLRFLALDMTHQHVPFGPHSSVEAWEGEEDEKDDQEKMLMDRHAAVGPDYRRPTEEETCGVGYTITCLKGFRNLEVLYLDQSCFWRAKDFWRRDGFEDIPRDGTLFRKLLPPSIKQLFLEGEYTPVEAPEHPRISADLLDLAQAAGAREFPHLKRVRCMGFLLEAPEGIQESFRLVGVDFKLEGPDKTGELFCPLCWIEPFCDAFAHGEYVSGR